MPTRTSLLQSAASLGGAGLAGGIRLVGAARPAGKPLHPRGDLVAGRLRRFGGHATGSPWLDEAGEDEVLVRRSRAVGLPASLPDIHGLALRVPLPGGDHGDVLLAMTGLGRVTRFVLTAGRAPTSRPMTTLLPYRTPSGPLVLGARATSRDSYELAHASLQGPWRVFATLTLSATDGPDPLLSFDPVLNPLPGLEMYGWIRRLREPAYATARHSR